MYILYRHCDDCYDRQLGVARPEWFSKEKCFLNLLNTIDDSVNGVIVTFDGNSKNFVNSFRNHSQWEKVKVYELEDGLTGAYENWLYSLKFASSLPNDEVIYFLENDYLHRKNWPQKVEDLYSSDIPFDYVSMLDGGTHYQSPLVERIFATRSSHWRSASSTCGSFMCAAHVFKEDFKNPMLRRCWTPLADENKELVDLHALLDFQLFGELRNRGRTLITAIPGLSTHCVSVDMSPAIDWEIVQKETT